MKEGKADASRKLQVRGVILPPLMLQALLPEVASVVKDALSVASGPSKQAQPTTEPQDTNKSIKQPVKQIILNPYSCNMCHVRFPFRHNLNVHQLLHEHECNTCKISFGSKKLLLKHRILHRIRNKPASIKPKNRLNTHTLLSTHTHRTQHTHANICKFGGKLESKSCSNIDIDQPSACQIPIQHPEIPEPPKYTCEICKETFEDDLSAASHSRTHVKMRSYSRKPKPVQKQMNNAIESVNVRNKCDKIEPSSNESVEKVDNCDRKIIKEESCDKVFNQLDLFAATGTKFQRVNVDEVIRESNQNRLDLEKLDEDIKIEVDVIDLEKKLDLFEATETKFQRVNVDEVITESNQNRSDLEKLDQDIKIEADVTDFEKKHGLTENNIYSIKVEPKIKAEDMCEDVEKFTELESCSVKLEPDMILEGIEAVDKKPCSLYLKKENTFVHPLKKVTATKQISVEIAQATSDEKVACRIFLVF